MIRWREERRRWFNAIAVLLVALLVGTFVDIAVRLVLLAAVANAVAGFTFVAVLAVFVFRAASRPREPHHDVPPDDLDG
jgi:membrane associated rhomboid family serine protease